MAGGIFFELKYVKSCDDARPVAMLGLGLGGQAKPCVRAVGLIVCITLVSMFYLMGLDQPMQLIRPAILPTLSDADATVKEGYLVWSPSCQIPDMDPHHESIKKLLKPAASIVCSRYGSLTYTDTPKAAHAAKKWDAPYILRVDAAMVHHYVPNKQNYSCCYADVTRSTPDKKYNRTADSKYEIGKCVDFDKEVTLKSESEFVLVRCSLKKKGSKGKEVYSNMHATIPAKPYVKEKLATKQANYNSSADDSRKLSVLFVGIDSVSRLNLIRTMPRTVKHLQKNGWIELRGYNKIGDNTFPNVMAILTGLSMPQLKKTCWPSKDSELDYCPFVWKEFSDQGYVTAFGEDVSRMSTFNYQKTGFINPPTDYYLRPYILAAEKKLQLKTRDQLDICLGPTSTTEHLLRYTADFVSTFRNALYFAFIWINNFSHNNHNTVAALDVTFLKFFSELTSIDTLNNSLIVFVSDHGMRFGKIRETYIGWLEERLPFIYMWVPDWFKQKYPDALKNIRTNENRLTSPYDLHLTLKDILVRNEHGNAVDNIGSLGNASIGCSKCASLFSEASYNRSCDDAGISPHFCTCNQYETLSTVGDTVQKAAKFVVSEIQLKLQKSVNRTQKFKKCAELKLKRLVNVRGRVQEKFKTEDYVLLIETTPGSALFEATVRYRVDRFEVLGMISRINVYWNQSTCISDSTLKMYCYCVSSV